MITSPAFCIVSHTVFLFLSFVIFVSFKFVLSSNYTSITAIKFNFIFCIWGFLHSFRCESPLLVLEESFIILDIYFLCSMINDRMSSLQIRGERFRVLDTVVKYAKYKINVVSGGIYSH